MHRVVTKYKNQQGQLVVEYGPWHSRRADAEAWADTLRAHRYQVEIESLHNFDPAASDLAQALSSMA